jgi:hypothetical protein
VEADELADDHHGTGAAAEAGRWRRGDWAILGGLLLTVFLFLLPALSLQAPVCYCDCPVESVPRAFGIARVVQSGGLPLWDFNTFAGARPYYVTNESAIFYPPMYPFFLLADLGDVAQATVLLLLAPYVLHLVWAAAGGYLFGRIAVGLHPAGAFLTGLIYSLSPEMGLQIMTPDVAYLFSYLPWVMLAATRFMATGRAGWWVTGTLMLALMASAGTPNFIIRTYFVTAATISLLWLLSAWTGNKASASPLTRAAVGRFAAAASMLVVGAAMNGFAWAGVLEGIDWIKNDGTISYEAASDMWTESSMPPLYLLTLFIPEFFGVLDNQHGWGLTLTEGVTNLSALSGGMATMVAVLGAVAFWLGRSPDRERRERGENEARLRLWTLVATILLVGTLLTIMGRYTPAFRILCAVMPWFFKIPHAVYYRFAECWSVAVLAGIGVSSLLTVPAFAERVGRWRLVAACIGMALVGAAIALLRPTTDAVDADFAFHHLLQFHELGWFLTRPVAYFVVVSATLLAVFATAGARLRAIVLVGAIAAETLAFAGPMFYSSLLFEQSRSGPRQAVDIQDRRYLTLDEHPHYLVAAELAEISRGARFVGYNARVDNQAWAVDGRALFGYSSKPLPPRFKNVVSRFADGLPYDLVLRGKPADGLQSDDDSDDEGAEPVGTTAELAGLPFFRNMNVGYVAGDLERGSTWVEQTSSLSVHSLPEPLPYVYTQDRIVGIEDEGQLERLVTGDLRRAAYLAPGPAADLPATSLGDDPGDGPASAAEIERFDELQKSNAIMRVGRERPNRTDVEIEVEEPAMLVLAETWHPGWRARVDGRRAEVLQVNYLQQGVWLDSGRHTVELEFFPSSLAYGLIVTLAAGTVVLVVALGALAAARRRQRA